MQPDKIIPCQPKPCRPVYRDAWLVRDNAHLSQRWEIDGVIGQ
jgi:hypothetical protein